MPKCVIIGGANIDVFGKTDKELILKDSNPGKINISFGGVARNVAENMMLLGQKTYFKTVFTDDIFGQVLYQKCLDDGFDLRYSKINKGLASSVYIALLDSSGDMQVAINDMTILDEMKITELEEMLADFTHDDWVVLDTNLSEEILTNILTNKHYKIAVDPISISKISKIANLLQYIDVFKPNIYEAKSLVEADELLGVIDTLVNKGIKELCITLNKDGVLYYNDGRYFRAYITQDIEMVNATGAGDAFFAAYIVRRISGHSIDDAICFALTASIIAIRSQETVARNMTVEMVLNEMMKLDIKKEEVC